MNGDEGTICVCDLSELNGDKCEPKPSKCACNGTCSENLCNGNGKCITMLGDDEESCFCKMSHSGEFCEHPKTCQSNKKFIRKKRVFNFEQGNFFLFNDGYAL